MVSRKYQNNHFKKPFTCLSWSGYSIFVIHQKNGGRFTRDGFNTRWRKARALAREATGLALDFTFHDLKAKGISDYDGSSKEKQAFSGHKTERQVATYDRRIKVVKTISKANESKQKG
ncbi:hypothetical protein [Photobacterium sp. 1_MG-2023]|uniref:hypothetical protein n=1 Tax=Photobacterium sp. 1_MG-2023 TaxID=3062646 RepID=UPI0026E11F2B|nr:hypothetical protein [Photobacterium sp. 1_MG-2023]MDO6704958.1 hypothetical protein [Photobacterium sp. 1_MG-2023]